MHVCKPGSPAKTIHLTNEFPDPNFYNNLRKNLIGFYS
jgi:hypothetical protein